MPLTKIDIAENLHAHIGIPKKECLDVVECLLEIMKDELSSGTPVKISGFGKWIVKSKRQRRDRDPQTGDEITIPPKTVITFQPSAVLRNAVNGK